jgi:glyoxylase-like metal-dependent hydrolase (beta-lactamase superfamily II)
MNNSLRCPTSRLQWLAALICLCQCVLPAFVPSALAQPTAAAFQKAALAALGGQAVNAIEFTGNGWEACLGQAWSVNEGWARWELTNYRRVIDYANGTSSQTAQRRAGMDADHIGGCGAQPAAAAAPQQSFIQSTAAWPDQLLIWLTPHGFLRLLESNKPVITQEGKGWKVGLPLVRDSITYKMIGHFNARHELLGIQTWIDDPVFDDMEVLAEFGPYQRYNGLNYPLTLVIKQGGFATLSLAIATASASNETLANRLPAPPRPPAPAAEGPKFKEIGKGIFAFLGGYQSVAVEFDKFVVVIDGLQNDARVQELIKQVKQAIPGKPIRYVVSTHSHFDHASGLRQFAAEEATLLTHEMNVAFFRKALAAPRTLRLNPTEPNTVAVKVQGIKDHFEISDGAGQRVDVYALGPSAHAADMLIAWLPASKTVVEADTLQPWISPAFGGKNGPHPFLLYLDAGLKKLNLDYQHFVPVHTPPTPPLMERADLEKVLATH